MQRHQNPSHTFDQTSDMEYLQMDGKWWLAVETDMSRGRDTTTSKESTQLQCTGAESLHCLLPALFPTTSLDQPADSTQHTDATRYLTKSHGVAEW